MPDLQIRTTQEAEGGTRLALEGELDVIAAAPLDEAVTSALESGTTELVIDLTPITFVDSTGLSHLLAARRQADAAQAGMRVLAPAGSEARVVIDLAGVGSLLGLEDPGA
jgi:anti-anti-sigma factor